MATDTRATSFVTGAAGFIGSELVKVLVARRPSGIRSHATRSEAARARAPCRSRARHGRPARAGSWQDEAAADWVFHVPPHAAYGPRADSDDAPHPSRGARVRWMRTCSTRWRQARRGGLCMWRTRAATARRGPRPITEDAPPQPSAWGRHLAPALDRLEDTSSPGSRLSPRFQGGCTATAGGFANCVIEPVMAGRRVLLFGKTGPWLSPIHVQDCARALVHLAEHGEPGGRYFLVNRDPIQLREFAATFARLANRPLRVCRVPAAATRLVVGSGPGRPPPGRRRVLEHPTARDRLPLPLSHARAGTPASPRSAR